jgi:outer membrane murein-binding lipoprotein Lpp
MKRFNRLLIGSVVLCLAIVLLAGCGVSKSDYDALQAENADLAAELAAAQSDLASLQADYNAVSNELAQIQAVCPPRDFSSISELEDWLRTNDVSEEPITAYAGAWYRKALSIQEDALADGYIISADYDYDAQSDTYLVYCVTIINGDIWYWDPETDEPYADYSLGKVK